MPSFDIVSQVDLQEVRNAVDQTGRELANRYDFKGTDSRVELAGAEIQVESSTEPRLAAAVDVLHEKLVRRQVSPRAISGGAPKPAAGGRFRSTFQVNQGIDGEAARELAKRIRDGKARVQVQIQGDSLRVSGKNRDDLQAVIRSLRELDYRVPLQFINFRG